MKIIGKTLDGDLIIQVSQAEWDGLQDGVRPKDHWTVRTQRFDLWPKTEAGKLLSTVKGYYGQETARKAFVRGEIDGSIQSLRDIADGTIRIKNFSVPKQTKLKALLDNHTTQTEEKS